MSGNEQTTTVSDNNVMTAPANSNVTIFSQMNALVELGNQLNGMLDSARVVRSLGDIKPILDNTLSAIQLLERAINIEEQVERYGHMQTRDYTAAVNRGEVPLIVQRRISGQPTPAPVIATPEAASEQETPETQPQEERDIWTRIGGIGGPTEGRARLGGVHQTIPAPVVNRETQPAPQREAGNAQTVENNVPLLERNVKLFKVE